MNKYLLGALLSLLYINFAFAQTTTTITTSSMGAMCDRVTDDTIALDAFFSKINSEIQLGKNVVGVVEGMCKTTGNLIYPKAGFKILGRDSQSGFLCAGDKSYCLDIRGGFEDGQNIKIIKSVYRGQTTIEVADSSLFAVGDHVIVNSYPKNMKSLLNQRQLNKILSKNGSILTLKYPSSIPITDLANASVQKMTTTNNVQVEQILVDGSLAKIGLIGGVRMSGLENSTVHSVKAQNFTSWYLLPSGVKQGATGIRIDYCSNCSIKNLTGYNLNQSTSYPVYLYFLASSTISNITVGGLTQSTAPIELVYSSNNVVDGVKNTGVYSHRLFKLFGSTGNVIKNVTLSGNNRVVDKNPSTGLSVSSGSAFNIFTNIKVSGARTCVWLNGTENNNNQFDGLNLSNCTEYVQGVKQNGYAISTAATYPYVDRNNSFKNVVKDSGDYLLLQGVDNGLSNSTSHLNMTVCSYVWSTPNIGQNTRLWQNTDCSNGLPLPSWVSVGHGQNQPMTGGEVSCSPEKGIYTASGVRVPDAKITCLFTAPQESETTFCKYTWTNLATGWRSQTWQLSDCTNGLPKSGWISIGQGVNGTEYGGQVGCYPNLGRHYTHPDNGNRSAEVRCQFVSPTKPGTTFCEKNWTTNESGTRSITWTQDLCKNGTPASQYAPVSQAQNGSGTVGQSSCSILSGSHTNLVSVTSAIIKCLFVGI